MKLKTYAVLMAVLMSSCARDLGRSSSESMGLKDAGQTVHLTEPCHLERLGNGLERAAVSADYRLHAGKSFSDLKPLPAGQAVYIAKYRKVLVNEAGPDTGAVGRVVGGAYDGAKFFCVISPYDKKPWK